MTITQSVELEEWKPPNFARVKQKPGKREDGMKAAPAISIADLDDDALDGLAYGWLAALYRKAGRDCPWVHGDAQ